MVRNDMPQIRLVRDHNRDRLLCVGRSVYAHVGHIVACLVYRFQSLQGDVLTTRDKSVRSVLESKWSRPTSPPCSFIIFLIRSMSEIVPSSFHCPTSPVL